MNLYLGRMKLSMNHDGVKEATRIMIIKMNNIINMKK